VALYLQNKFSFFKKIKTIDKKRVFSEMDVEALLKGIEDGTKLPDDLMSYFSKLIS
jgi:hypothetical protein